MRYLIEGGIQKSKTNLKKIVAGTITTALLAGAIALPAMASQASENGWYVNDNASPNACFGQARGYFAQGGPNGVLAPYNNGYYISQRAGTNPDNNDGFIATYCTP